MQPIPALTARVTDLTGTLDAQQKQTLEGELAALEQRKGAQIAVLIVPTTEPEDIAQYAIRVFDQWKLGRKNIDDGVLLIVAKNDHRVRIEVARGLEAAIPDAAAARIIREYITPRFRAGDYFGGVHDATGALTKLVDGEELPPPLTDEHDRKRGANNVFNAAVWAFFIGLWARSMFGRLPTPPRAGLVGVASGSRRVVDQRSHAARRRPRRPRTDPWHLRRRRRRFCQRRRTGRLGRRRLGRRVRRRRWRIWRRWLRWRRWHLRRRRSIGRMVRQR